MRLASTTVEEEPHGGNDDERQGYYDDQKLLLSPVPSRNLRSDEAVSSRATPGLHLTPAEIEKYLVHF